MPSSEGPVDPASRDKYLLQVTAGPSYDSSTHTEVPVNGPSAHIIENDLMTCHLKVKIRDYHGLPRNSPSSSDYFSHPLHTSDRYSIGFSFVPKKDIPGQDLVTGFDFDHSIKDRLPPGFRYAMRIVTTILDPGIYSDPYSDKPYLYGPALSSFFTFRIGDLVSSVPPASQTASFDKEDSSNSSDGVIEEGADGSGSQIRTNQAIPPKSNKRRKNFLNPQKRENFVFEKGRMYQADFFNPYLDFANFALRIPGFSISVVKYIDEKTHQLRFVLKNRATDECLFVVVFTLLYGQKLEDTLAKGEEEKESQSQSHARRTEDGMQQAGDAGGISQRPESPDRGRQRPETSSSAETPTPSSRSSSSTPSSSGTESREGRSPATTATATLANSIYSGFAALGFGKTASSSESSTSGSANGSPERPRKSLNQRVDELDDKRMEDILQMKHSNVQ